jgi:rubrerythrin
VSPRDTIHDHEVYQKARDALDRIGWQRDWSDWLLVSEALSAGRTEAMERAGTNQPIGRLYNQWFGEVLLREELGTDRLDSTTRSSLFDIAKHRPEIEAWRDKLPLKRRSELNSPNAVLRNWKKAQPELNPERAEKKKKRRNETADLSKANKELSDQLEQITARLKEVEEERDQAKREDDPQFDETEELKYQREQLWQRIEKLEQERNQTRDEAEKLKQARDSWVCSKCGEPIKVVDPQRMKRQRKKKAA